MNPLNSSKIDYKAPLSSEEKAFRAGMKSVFSGDESEQSEITKLRDKVVDTVEKQKQKKRELEDARKSGVDTLVGRDGGDAESIGKRVISAADNLMLARNKSSEDEIDSENKYDALSNRLYSEPAIKDWIKRVTKTTQSDKILPIMYRKILQERVQSAINEFFGSKDNIDDITCSGVSIGSLRLYKDDANVQKIVVNRMVSGINEFEAIIHFGRDAGGNEVEFNGWDFWKVLDEKIFLSKDEPENINNLARNYYLNDLKERTEKYINYIIDVKNKSSKPATRLDIVGAANFFYGRFFAGRKSGKGEDFIGFGNISDPNSKTTKDFENFVLEKTTKQISKAFDSLLRAEFFDTKEHLSFYRVLHRNLHIKCEKER